LIAGLLGSDYRTGQMTYDLRRLRLTGLIHRLPHSNRYTLTNNGIRIAIFYTKIYNRLLVPLTATTDHPKPHPNYDRHCAPSTTTSMTTSPAPASHRPPKT
jgi:hypothetical protein